MSADTETVPVEWYDAVRTERDSWCREAEAQQARAEKAEQERDEALAELRTHLSWGCAWSPEPMTTVDEDGRVCRMEMATDGADCLYLTREGFATTIPAHSADRALYVLVPIEDAP